VSTGLVMVNIIKPGNKLPEQTRESLMELYGSDVESSASVLGELKKQGPLQPLVDIVPENIFESASDNSSMLQVVFFALIIGVAFLHILSKTVDHVLRFFVELNVVIIRVVVYLIWLATYGVFALIASLVVERAGSVPD